jgi:hypothetical protein
LASNRAKATAEAKTAKRPMISEAYAEEQRKESEQAG